MRTRAILASQWSLMRTLQRRSREPIFVRSAPNPQHSSITTCISACGVTRTSADANRAATADAPSVRKVTRLWRMADAMTAAGSAGGALAAPSSNAKSVSKIMKMCLGCALLKFSDSKSYLKFTKKQLIQKHILFFQS